MISTSLLTILIGTSHAFSPASTQHHRPLRKLNSQSASTALYGVNKRAGRLTNNVSLDDEGKVRGVLSNKQKQKLGNKKGKKKQNGEASISPLLAEWAKDDGDTSVKTSSSPPSSSVYASFNEEKGTKGKNKKRNKKGDKRSTMLGALTIEQTAQMDDLLGQITEMLTTTNCNVSELVASIASLVELNSSFSNDATLMPTLKSITSVRPTNLEGDKQPSYRLAWVGSDNAICHVGTSLHKVPLARLQEMYLLLGYNRWELLEVIRILGPFPNVRNTLKGDLKLKKLNGPEREGVRMEIDYRSMIDGTGKEILAGKEDNVKNVNMNVWFASEKALVCTVPNSDDDEGETSSDPLGGNGEKILFFVAEENLEEELEKLRAA